jgi:hypothetical protein
MNYDGIISGFLDRRNPAEFQAFMDVCGAALFDAMPMARRQLARYQHILDVDDVIAMAFERSLNHLRRQFLGQEVDFRFEPAFGLTFGLWFLNIVGYPGRGRRSGLAGTERLRSLREWSRQVPVNDDLVENPIVEEPQNSSADVLDRALGKLSSRNEFIVRARYGVHKLGVLDPTGVEHLAVLSRLQYPHRRTLRRRAETLFVQGRSPTLRLTSKDIGHLLEISARRVNQIKSSAMKILRVTGPK